MDVVAFRRRYGGVVDAWAVLGQGQASRVSLLLADCEPHRCILRHGLGRLPAHKAQYDWKCGRPREPPDQVVELHASRRGALVWGAEYYGTVKAGGMGLGTRASCATLASFWRSECGPAPRPLFESVAETG